MINTVMLIGNAGRDAELRVTSQNQNFATFSLATSKRFQGHDGEWRENTQWHKIKILGKAAIRAADEIKKGDLVIIQNGEINYYEHEGKSYTEIKTFSYKLTKRNDSDIKANQLLPPSETSKLDPWKTNTSNNL